MAAFNDVHGRTWRPRFSPQTAAECGLETGLHPGAGWHHQPDHAHLMAFIWHACRIEAEAAGLTPDLFFARLTDPNVLKAAGDAALAAAVRYRRKVIEKKRRVRRG